VALTLPTDPENLSQSQNENCSGTMDKDNVLAGIVVIVSNAITGEYPMFSAILNLFPT
jgi:hypothetical protein